VSGLILRVQPSGVKTFYTQWARGRRTAIGRPDKGMTIEGARVKARKILLDAAENGEPTLATRKRTLGEFFREHYGPHALANQKDAKGNLRAIELEFGGLFEQPLGRLSPFDFQKYQVRKLKSGVKPRTVNRHFDRIRAVLRKAVEWKHLAASPLADVKRAKEDDDPIVRFLDAQEAARLRKALADRDAKMRAERDTANRWRAQRGYALYPEIDEDGYGDRLTPMVILTLNTGMRRGELTQIAWADVNFERAQLTIRAGYAKSRRTRHLPLNSEAVDVLQRWRRQAGEQERVFDVARVDKSWKAVLKAAGIKDFRWHDMRHHFASRLVMAGVDLNAVRELLGHADLGMTLRYAHLADDHKAEAVARLVAAA
jgi:integrase